MTRDHIETTVIKYLARAVDGIDPTNVDTALSMKDLGANSIDIVEVVSSCMRELRLKVPRSELVQLTNIDGLVDLLEGVAQTKAAETQATETKAAS
jgi:acyl carrier protein